MFLVDTASHQSSGAHLGHFCTELYGIINDIRERPLAIIGGPDFGKSSHNDIRERPLAIIGGPDFDKSSHNVIRERPLAIIEGLEDPRLAVIAPSGPYKMQNTPPSSSL